MINLNAHEKTWAFFFFAVQNEKKVGKTGE
jgi:hypothetical protein